MQTQACGICRSDWHLWQHDWTWLGIDVALPRVPGHEFGGVIVETGRDVKGFRYGDRITVCPAYGGVIGVQQDGGYASLVKVPNADAALVGLPDCVDSFTAAALGCRS